MNGNLKKILTVTVGNASSNDKAIEYLRRRFNHWECGLLEGKYLHVRCAAHILNLVVKDGLKDVGKSILKIRALVKYVRSSPARLQKFKACVEEEKLNSNSLVCLDVETRWNSMYLMLESAIKFKKVFANLLMKDSALQNEMVKFGGDPTNMEWKQVSPFLSFLKIFYDATLKLSGSHYVTCNAYVNEIFGVGLVISEQCHNEDVSLRQMASQMKAKYDKYWGNIDNLNLLLFISLSLTQEGSGNMLSGWCEIATVKRNLMFCVQTLSLHCNHCSMSTLLLHIKQIMCKNLQLLPLLLLLVSITIHPNWAY